MSYWTLTTVFRGTCFDQAKADAGSLQYIRSGRTYDPEKDVDLSQKWLEECLEEIRMDIYTLPDPDPEETPPETPPKVKNPTGKLPMAIQMTEILGRGGTTARRLAQAAHSMKWPDAVSAFKATRTVIPLLQNRPVRVPASVY